MMNKIIGQNARYLYDDCSSLKSSKLNSKNNRTWPFDKYITQYCPQYCPFTSWYSHHVTIQLCEKLYSQYLGAYQLYHKQRIKFIVIMLFMLFQI